MASSAINLARELCICAVVDGHIVPAMPSEGLYARQIEAFYRLAQAQALRDAAYKQSEYGRGGDLLRMAEELERGA